MIGTAKLLQAFVDPCSCHPGRPAGMVEVDRAKGRLVFRKRTHGTYHQKEMRLTEIVEALDPEGTTYRRAGTA